jgi:hypothetical protein
MIYTAIFMFVAVAAFIVVNDLQRTEIPYQQNSLAKETGQEFVTILTLSMKGGQGFSYNYTFPRSIFGAPYTIDMRNINKTNSTILLEWQGNYGNFSYQYNVPRPRNGYQVVADGCLGDSILRSDRCTNMLMLRNDGGVLTITQSP